MEPKFKPLQKVKIILSGAPGVVKGYYVDDAQILYEVSHVDTHSCRVVTQYFKGSDLETV